MKTLLIGIIVTIGCSVLFSKYLNIIPAICTGICFGLAAAIISTIQHKRK